MSVFIAIYYFKFQCAVFCRLKFSDTWPNILNKADTIYGEIFSPSVFLHWYIDTLIYGIMLMVSQIFESVFRPYVHFVLISPGHLFYYEWSEQKITFSVEKITGKKNW